MSLVLNQDSEPEVTIKAWGFPVNFQGLLGSSLTITGGVYTFTIGEKDMCMLVEYWITNCDLDPRGDARAALLIRLREYVVTEGWNGPKSLRFAIPARSSAV